MAPSSVDLPDAGAADDQARARPRSTCRSTSRSTGRSRPAYVNGHVARSGSSGRPRADRLVRGRGRAARSADGSRAHRPAGGATTPAGRRRARRRRDQRQLRPAQRVQRGHQVGRVDRAGHDSTTAAAATPAAGDEPLRQRATGPAGTASDARAGRRPRSPAADATRPQPRASARPGRRGVRRVEQPVDADADPEQPAEHQARRSPGGSAGGWPSRAAVARASPSPRRAQRPVERVLQDRDDDAAQGAGPRLRAGAQPPGPPHPQHALDELRGDADSATTTAVPSSYSALGTDSQQPLAGWPARWPRRGRRASWRAAARRTGRRGRTPRVTGPPSWMPGRPVRQRHSGRCNRTCAPRPPPNTIAEHDPDHDDDQRRDQVEAESPRPRRIRRAGPRRRSRRPRRSARAAAGSWSGWPRSPGRAPRATRRRGAASAAAGGTCQNPLPRRRRTTR